MNKEKKIMYAALSAVRFALFNLVPEALKAIEVSYQNLKVDLFFYCSRELSEDEIEIIKIDFEAEFSDRFDETMIEYYDQNVQYKIFSKIICLEKSRPILKRGCLAYKVYEPGKFERSDYLFPENFNEDLIEIYGSLLRPRILIVMQKALLNHVEDNLREVDVAWDEKTIWLYFYYDDIITDLNKSLAKAAAAEFIQFFPEHKLDFKILLSDELDKYASEHDWSAVFLRGNIKKA